MVKTQDPDFDRLKTREKIIEAASELFVEKGYAAASISKVAARAKVLAGSVYWAFPSKEALFAEVIRSAGRRWYKKYFPKSEILPVDIHGLRDEFVQLAAGFAADPAFIKLLLVVAVEHQQSEDLKQAVGIIRQFWERHLAVRLGQIYPNLDASQIEELAIKCARISMYLVDGMYISIQIDGRKLDLSERFSEIASLTFDHIENYARKLM